jgi:hypothetical protein
MSKRARWAAFNRRHPDAMACERFVDREGTRLGIAVVSRASQSEESLAQLAVPV